MIYHFRDEDESVVAFFQVNQDPKKVIKKLNSLTNTSFEIIKNDQYEDAGSFPIDTLIIHSNLFTEDLLELIAYGVCVYIIDY
jgi:hypothetical protein